MNTLKKLLSISLAAASVLSVLASCANDREEESGETAHGTNVTESGSPSPDFVDADYGKEEFKFLHYGDTATDFHDNYIWSDGVTGGAIGDAVAERNLLTEEKYNIVIAAEECSPMGEAVKRMQAGQCDFEVIYEWGSRSVSAALDGQLYDFLELENVDLDASYWVPNAVEDLTVADRLFVTTNYISMNSISWGGMVYFNKVLMDKLGYTYPYDYVTTNSWTCDVMLAMMNGAEEDVNGDGQMTLIDQYGAFGTSLGAALYYEPLTEKNDDGSYTVIGYTERMVAAYNEYANKLREASTIGYGDVWDEVDSSIAPSIHVATRMTVFGEDHALFMSGSIDMSKELVNMQSDYGVVPNAKAKPEDEWYTDMDFNAPMFTLPIQLADPAMTGVILEYMAYESEQNLLPAYYETTIKTKRMEDVRDYEMLDIVRANVRFEWENLYLSGVEDCVLSGMRGRMLTAGAFKSVYARYGAKAQSEIDWIVEKLESITG